MDVCGAWSLRLLVVFQLRVPGADALAKVVLVDGGQLLIVQNSLSLNPHVGNAKRGKRRKLGEWGEDSEQEKGGIGDTLVALGGVNQRNGGVEHRLELKEIKVDGNNIGRLANLEGSGDFLSERSKS